ncbi:Tryptophan synthase alpha chain [Thalassoglobus neptunius]|uniref:Tryptophan synthase alpha chain n=1 Tax=Thalassoglobus neptunius TaxID=1938619 RepID=A0A5C5X0A9_9PLAN|nr:tryptophan synthase subunit alpha [Thalassoglobus neptunius]TWT55595.1 Tryptophan synthase alpha chain [Thalassoglobus neptunius]
MDSRISAVFASLKEQNQMAFMPFITAGDPDLAATQQVIRTLGASNVDMIEIGFPYSDPIADGPVIQASYTRALESKVSVSQIFKALGELDHEELPPLVAMVSFAIVFRTGVDQFLSSCVESGISGLIIPDLPGDEAAEVFEKVKGAGLDLIQLVAPTSPRERVRKILKSCSGFVYCIAVAGTTGERERVADSLLDQLKWLREETDLPLAVGFGISKPDHVEPLRGLADGVIIGSAIVRRFQELADKTLSSEDLQKELTKLAGDMVTATHTK